MREAEVIRGLERIQKHLNEIDRLGRKTEEILVRVEEALVNLATALEEKR